MINELQKKQTSLVMNLKSVARTKEPTKSSQGDAPTQSDTGDNSKKRKQNSFLVEVQERAEVLWATFEIQLNLPYADTLRTRKGGHLREVSTYGRLKM